MKISKKILEDWGDVSELQIAFAKDVLIEELNEQLELAQHYNASEKLSERIYELKQE